MRVRGGGLGGDWGGGRGGDWGGGASALPFSLRVSVHFAKGMDGSGDNEPSAPVKQADYLAQCSAH